MVMDACVSQAIKAVKVMSATASRIVDKNFCNIIDRSSGF